jgi:hypothetical protein
MRAHVVLSSAATLALICASGVISSAQAGAIDVATLTQLMIENEGNATTLLGLGFGVDPSSPVNFTSVVDPSAMSYSFTPVSGSMYEGQDVTLAGSGTYDPATNVLTTTASIGLGATIFVDTGTLDLSTGSSYVEATELTPPMPTPFFAEDMTDDECKTVPGFFEDFCYYTKDGVKIAGSDYLSVLSMTLPSWTFLNSGVFIVSGMGSSPLVGGDGTSTMTIMPLPEPSTWAMMVFGFAGVGFFGYRASHRRIQRLAAAVQA